MRRRPIPSLLAGLGLVASVLVGSCGAGAAGTVGPFDGKEAIVRAVNVAFEPDEVTLPAGVPLRIVLDNQDAGVPHDMRVFQGDTELGTSPTITGPGQAEVRFGPLTPARYQFQCTIHPSMIGTILVTGP